MPEVSEVQIDGVSWKKIGEKGGGARPAGEYGGIYEGSNGKKALFKRDNCAQDIAEFLGTRIHNATVPDHSPEMILARIPPSDRPPSRDGSDVYMASVFFDNYEDLYKNIYRRGGYPVPGNRPRGVRFGNKVFRKGLKQNDYSGFPEVMATSLLIGDFDVHWGNIGVVSDKKLVRLDFGAAFDHLKDEINPHSISEHLPGLGPTNHFRDFPRTMKLNENFIAELERVSKENLDQVIDNSFKELEKFYSPETIKDFGKRLGVQFEKDDRYIANTVKNRLKERMKERQVSLKNFATELKTDLCITKDETTREWKLDQSKFENVVKDNPKYFQEVAEGKRKIKQ